MRLASARRPAAFALALVAAASTRAAATPDLASARPIGTFIVYSDDRRPGLFYYGPGELGLAHDRGGRPELHFLQLRYTGSAPRGDRGTALHRSILSFRVSMAPASASQLSEVSRRLAGAGRVVDLRPLPVQRLEAAVIYTPVGGAEDAASALPEGRFEEGAGAPSDASAFWTERTFTLGLDARTSELFGGALGQGQLALSLSYAFYAKGVAAAAAAPEPLVGPAKAVSELRRVLALRRLQAAPSSEGGALKEQLVKAGAFAVFVDTRRWPELLRRVDVNERVPPGYPLLDVYCYDFNAASADPVAYEKQVEIEAEGAGGGLVRAGVRFGRDQPDIYAHSLRFGMAVRLDRPYRFRVTEVRADGTSTTAPWRERASWAELLDVSTPSPAAAAPASDPAGGRS